MSKQRYFADIGTMAESVVEGTFEAATDAAAKRQLSRAMKQAAALSSVPLTGWLYRWDEAAQAPASLPIHTVAA